MKKEKLLKIFNELLEDWYSAECTLEGFATFQDEDSIEKQKREYAERFNAVLKQ
ncbi:hypothetical protein [Bacillus xiamenensis]|uniref:hypothetical protein n=1 Tax=Bacillus xiamenensis TaxID=1178537 RepID=UPI0002F57EED|nr:hypothetical protein [Bacillus xiamenensis]